MTQMKMSIFVLADTHNKFPEKLSILAQDADEIWHLGDVCAESILDELRAIGPPVTVVRGNCDSNSEWPLVVDLVRAAARNFGCNIFRRSDRRKMSMLSCTVTRTCREMKDAAVFCF